MSYVYVGTELDLFADGRRTGKPTFGARCGGFWAGRCWKSAREMGAPRACSAMAVAIAGFASSPMPSLADRLDRGNLRRGITGLLRTRKSARWPISIRHERFDTILYMDVLEHIADDRAELACARPISCKRAGHLIVLAPAHQWLFHAI